MKRILLALTLLVFAVACSEDDSTEWGMELALDKGDYQKIVNTLEPRGVANLSDREKYLLQCAYMGLAGFDPISKLDLFLSDTTTANALSILLSSPEGALTTTQANAKSILYANAVTINKTHNSGGDEDIVVAGGVAAAMKATMDAMKLASAVGDPRCTNLDISNSADVAYCIGQAKTGIDGNTDIANALTDLANAATIIGNGKLKEKLDEIANKGGLGSIADYIAAAFN